MFYFATARDIRAKASLTLLLRLRVEFDQNSLKVNLYTSNEIESFGYTLIRDFLDLALGSDVLVQLPQLKNSLLQPQRAELCNLLIKLVLEVIVDCSLLHQRGIGLELRGGRAPASHLLKRDCHMIISYIKL